MPNNQNQNDPPELESLTYDGIELGIGSKRSISINPVYDSTDRVVILQRLNLRVESYVTPEQGGTLEDIKTKLSVARKVLKIANIGFGKSLAIGENETDLEGGPKPRIITWEPMGTTSEAAAFVVWVCEVATHLDLTESRYLKGPISFNYSSEYRIDSKGWSDRVYTGRLQVVKERNTSGQDNQITYNADDYRDRIKIARPSGFKREQVFSLSECKSILTFTINDSQIRSRNAYPPGVVDIQCSHRVRATRSQLGIIQNTITCTVEVAADQPAQYAWLVFTEIAGRRIQNARDNGVQVMIEDIDIEEQLFGTSITATVSYRNLSKIIPPNWLHIAGVFQPAIEFNEWDNWDYSMDTVYTRRGWADLRPQPISDDRLVSAKNQETPDIEDAQFNLINTLTQPSSPFCNRRPPPNESWAHFEAAVDIVQSENGQVNTWTPIKAKVIEDGKLSLNEISAAGRGSRAEVKYMLTEGRGYTNYLIFKGKAIRVGYKIPLPKLVIAGQEMKMLKKDFRQKFLGVFYCQPVYAAVWEIWYIIKDLPEKVSASKKTDGTDDGDTNTNTNTTPSP